MHFPGDLLPAHYLMISQLKLLKVAHENVFGGLFLFGVRVFNLKEMTDIKQGISYCLQTCLCL